MCQEQVRILRRVKVPVNPKDKDHKGSCINIERVKKEVVEEEAVGGNKSRTRAGQEQMKHL